MRIEPSGMWRRVAVLAAVFVGSGFVVLSGQVSVPPQVDRSVHDYAGVLALSAIDQALWDILGKSLNVPVHTILGGRCREEIHVYANINRATTDRSPEGFARNAVAAVEDGFDAIKLAPFDRMQRGIDSAGDAA